MHNREHGIVLRRPAFDPEQASVLTRGRGRVALRAQLPRRYQQMLPGTLFSFALNTRKRSRKDIWAEDLQIIIYPTISELDHLQVLHRFLELSYYFLPAGEEYADVFDVLCSLLTGPGRDVFRRVPARVIGELYVLKFFSLIGFHPEAELRDYLAQFDFIAGYGIDLPKGPKVSSLVRELNDYSESLREAVSAWLRMCVQWHPCQHLFKTVRQQ